MIPALLLLLATQPPPATTTGTTAKSALEVLGKPRTPREAEYFQLGEEAKAIAEGFESEAERTKQHCAIDTNALTKKLDACKKRTVRVEQVVEGAPQLVGPPVSPACPEAKDRPRAGSGFIWAVLGAGLGAAPGGALGDLIGHGLGSNTLGAAGGALIGAIAGSALALVFSDSL